MKIIRSSITKMGDSIPEGRKAGLLVLFLSIAVLLAACGGASVPSASTPASSAATSKITTTQSTAAVTSSATKPSDNAGQGAGANNSNGAEFGLPEAEIAKRVDAAESLIATCMRDAGFEYIPADYATVRKAMDSNSRRSGLSADQFRTQFGYGITTQFAGANNQAMMGEGEQNVRIRNSLSTADRAAYLHALYGDNPSATFVVSLDSENFSQTGGCTRRAVEQVFTPAELGPNFVNYQNAQGARVDQDPRVVAAEKDWAACMRQAGYSYNNSDEIKTDLVNHLDAIAHGAAPDTLPADANAALKQLQGEELAIAGADHQCNVKFVDPIRKQVETQLLGPAANQQ